MWIVVNCESVGFAYRRGKGERLCEWGCEAENCVWMAGCVGECWDEEHVVCWLFFLFSFSNMGIFGCGVAVCSDSAHDN